MNLTPAFFIPSVLSAWLTPTCLASGGDENKQLQRIGPFDAARIILGSASRTPLRERYELFFTDYSLLPLLVHQNYLSSLMNLDAKVSTSGPARPRLLPCFFLA